MKLGLCCKFQKENIKFKTFTKKKYLTLSEQERFNLVSRVVDNNINSLKDALTYCSNNNLAFRIGSDIFPLFDFAPEYDKVLNSQSDNISIIRKIIKDNGIDISMHPDQFTVLNSPKREVVENSISILNNHYKICKMFSDNFLINIHVGGVYGDKESAIQRFIYTAKALNKGVFKRISIENDELSYSVEDCLKISSMTGLKVCFDIHHEMVFRWKNGMEYNKSMIRELFLKCKETFKDQKQYIHISSPRGSGSLKEMRSHNDYINNTKFPLWLEEEDVVVDIEAKYKELAIRKLKNDLNI